MKKKFKFTARVTSVILSVLLFADILPLQTFAADIAESRNISESGMSLNSETVEMDNTDEKEDTPVIQGEVKDKRDKYTKTFRMSDGSYQVVQYTSPVHFKGENGSWEDYDNSLTSVDAEDTEPQNGARRIKSLVPQKDYSNNSADYNIRISEKINDAKIAEISKDGYKLSWNYENISKKRGTVKSKEDDNDPATLENASSEILFKSAFPKTDIQYIIGTDSTKENFILNSANAQNEFIAEYKCDGLTAYQVDSRTIDFRTNNGDVIFTLNAPYMYDANYETSNDIAYELVSQSGGTAKIKMIVSSDWLQNNERKFPVTVDPLIQTSQELNNEHNLQSAFISSKNAGTCYGRGSKDYEGSIYVGKTNGYGKTCGLLKIANLPELGISDKVVHAELDLFATACYPELQVNLHRVTTDWQQNTVCWNSGVGFDSSVVDYQTVQIMERYDEGKDRWQRFEITDLVRGWYSGEIPNYGVFLRSDKENSSSQARAWFLSSAYTTSDIVRPILRLSYRNMSGFEDYWSYTDLSAGQNGSASVNNYNGNLVYAQPVTTDCGGNLMPVNISLVYNSNVTDCGYSYMGNGFLTNYHVYVCYDAGTAPQGYRFFLHDADGTKHWFYYDESGIGKDEDGLGYTLQYLPDEDRYKLKDKDENIMYFNHDGYLTEVVAPNGVKTVVGYDSVNGHTRLKTVTDGAGRVYTYEYELSDYPEFCTGITDPAGRKTSFYYYQGKLAYVAFADGTGCSYSYNDYSLLSVVTDSMNKQFVADYDSSSQHRVAAVETGIAGNYPVFYAFSYRQNETDVTDKQGRTLTYQFNDYGQTKGIVSDEDGTAKFFELGKSTDNDKANPVSNKILSQSRVLSSATNYMVNPQLANGFNGYWQYADNPNGAYEIKYDTENGHLGNGCLQISKADNSAGKAYLVQSFDKYFLPAGTYTLSAYITTSNVWLTGDGTNLGVEIWGDNGIENAVYADSINHTIHGDGQWERRSVTFTIDSGKSIRVTMGLNGNASGYAWFDDVQLERSGSESCFNLVENGSFTNNLTGWENVDPNTVTGAGLNGFDWCGISYSDVTDKFRGALQYINVSGHKNDVFSFGMWLKGDSAPTDNGLKENDRYQPAFKIALHYYDAAGNWLGMQHYNANCDVNSWQFVTGKAKIPTDYAKIAIQAVYSYNVNTLYTTGAFCYKEDYGETYDYDKNGNLVSAVDLQKTESQFAYYGNQMSKMLNPSGSKYMYTYTDKKELLYALSSDGQDYGFYYDDKGNVTKTEMAARAPAVTLESGKEYIIVNSYSGKSLDSGDSPAVGNSVVTYSYSPGYEKQHWVLEAVPGETDVYNIRSVHSNNANLYLDIADGSSAQAAPLQLCTKNGNSAQKFKIVKKQDNTFAISTGCTDYTRVLDGQLDTGNEIIASQTVKQASCTADSLPEGMRWFFYPAEWQENGASIISEATYTDDKNFVATSKDQLGNVTSYNYDTTKGVLNSSTDALGRETSYTYNAANSRLESVSSGGMTNSYVYNNAGQVTDIDVNGAVKYKLGYDSLGRTTETKVGNGTSYRMLSSFEYDSATGLLLKQNYGNGDCINYSYDNLDRLSYKMYNGDGNRKLSYSYGRDGNIASNFDSATGEKTVFCYDLANRAVGQKTYVGSTLSSSLAYTYADKTNYLVGVKHKFALGEQTIGYRYGNLSVGEMPDQIYGVTWNGKEKIGYSYDGFGRITDKTVMPSLSKTLHNRYTYYNRESGNRTSTTVKSLETANGTYTYTYDAVGNILSINDGTYTVSYVYDGLNQLVRENDQRADTTTVYTYTNGNITGKKVYKYTLGNVGEEIKSSSYGYSNSEWRDLLTSFNGQAVTYDEIGNPITFGSKTFEWCGRQLERITDGDNTYVYSYNTDGDRVSKTVNGVKTEYFYNGSILAGQKTGDETLIFMYDNNGDAFGFIYNGEEYYYIKNVQNDIVAIADKNGTVVANYYYDAWGNVTQITGDTALAQTNPLRYRSYYYDSETGYYHLKSRYYSPEVGRFLNADSVLDSRNTNALNLFVYCGNNPVNNQDPDGQFFFGALIGGIVGGATGALAAAVKGKSIKAGLLTGAATGALTGAFCELAAIGAIPAILAVALCGVFVGAGNLINQYANYRAEKKSQTKNKNTNKNSQNNSSQGKKRKTSSNGKVANECNSFMDYVDVKSIVVSSVTAMAFAPASIGASCVVNSAFSGVDITGVTGFVAQFAANFAMGGNISILQSIIDLF